MRRRWFKQMLEMMSQKMSFRKTDLGTGKKRPKGEIEAMSHCWESGKESIKQVVGGQEVGT